IPLCELDNEKSQYEEQLVRWAHTTADVDVKTARETALKLFALACRSEIEQRALELMELLKDEKLLPLAAKYASRLGRMHLADKLSDLADRWHTDADKLNVAHNSHFQDGIWMPICDTTAHSKGASDTWFIVSISEPTQTVRVILCRGTSYPLTVPRPIVTEIPLQVSTF
ncbi:WD repeat and HMG-box DNA-binding protein 1, partial [Papilio xuthus]